MWEATDILHARSLKILGAYWFRLLSLLQTLHAVDVSVGHVNPRRQKPNDDTDSFVNAILAEAEGIKAHADDFLPESAPVEEVLV
jgi:hypothetical protein